MLGLPGSAAPRPVGLLPYVAASHPAAVLVVRAARDAAAAGSRIPVGRPERVALWVAVPAAVGVVFGLGAELPLSFLVVAVLAWSASRLGARAAAVQLVVVGIVAGGADPRRSRALRRGGSRPFPAAAAALVQLFLVASALVVLVLAVSAAQRAAAIAELADQRRFDQAVLEVVNAAVVACDAEGTIVVRNAAHRGLAGDQWPRRPTCGTRTGHRCRPGSRRCDRPWPART